MSSIIKFANGEEHSCSHCVTDGNGNAYIALDDVTFLEAASIFSSPEYTKKIERGDKTLINYTECLMLNVQPYGIQGYLRGGYDESRESETIDNGGADS